MAKGKVCRRWHVIVGDYEAPVIRADCDDEDRAHAFADLLRARHPDVEVVHVIDARRSAP